MNPFITTGYAGPEYFCDRIEETKVLTDLLMNGNNVALMSPRRYGKTDLIRHCFGQKEISEKYCTFIIDVYSTKSLAEMTERMGKSILGLGNPKTTLDEIFAYLSNAEKPCLVAIDEFQQITNYADKNVEATLRTYIQYCPNAKFVFSGSHREMMGSMFTSSARPFYQSATIINLPPIREELYAEFCKKHFAAAGKCLDDEVVPELYKRFDGTTFYLQKVMNILFMRTNEGETCVKERIADAVDYIIDFSADTYEDLLYQLPEKQKQIIQAIALEGKAKKITSRVFVRKYALSSASSVNSAVKGLLEKGLLNCSRGVYQVNDMFFATWLTERYMK